ncbi:MAG: HEAT repeat domain-containing protein, partial [Promethearchaeota archaeon]
STRWTIAIILGQVGDPRATDELIEALSDQDPDIRRITLHAISHIHGDRVRAAITQCLEDEDPKVRRDAATILEKLKKEDR